MLSINAFAQKQKPNIVMIAIDDLNDWVGVYGGHPQVKTPNIDKLAQTSMVFRNASCPGPVCGPSRSALLSGFMPATTGIYGNANNMLNSALVQTHATLPEYFSKNGFLTISSGKVFHTHTTANGEDHGQWAFDVWHQVTGGNSGVQEDKLFSCSKGIINGKKIENPLYASGPANDMYFGPAKGLKEDTRDYRTAKWAEKTLQEDYDKPFFLSIGISKPHLPFVVPEEFFNLYGRDTIMVPEYRMDDLDDILDKNGNKANKPDESFLWAKHYGIEKDVVRAYLAAVSYADACVGVVLDALAKSKYADNTIVVLWGDHGWHLGEKLRYRKATLWREVTQLPLMIHVPGMKSKQDCYRNVNLIDLYPTLIDLCKLPQKKGLDGKSIQPLLENPTQTWTPTVTTYQQGNHSIMSEKWHYITFQKGVEELYNLQNDPMEWTNLANISSAEIDSVKKSLKAYVPSFNAVVVKSVGGDEEADDKGKARKEIDATIKPKRILSVLK